jgi:hypothetical protein
MIGNIALESMELEGQVNVKTSSQNGHNCTYNPMHPLTGTPSGKLECPNWFMPMKTNHGTPIFQMGCPLEGGVEMP